MQFVNNNSNNNNESITTPTTKKRTTVDDDLDDYENDDGDYDQYISKEMDSELNETQLENLTQQFLYNNNNQNTPITQNQNNQILTPISNNNNFPINNIISSSNLTMAPLSPHAHMRKERRLFFDDSSPLSSPNTSPASISSSPPSTSVLMMTSTTTQPSSSSNPTPLFLKNHSSPDITSNGEFKVPAAKLKNNTFHMLSSGGSSSSSSSGGSIDHATSNILMGGHHHHQMNTINNNFQVLSSSLPNSPISWGVGSGSNLSLLSGLSGLNSSKGNTFPSTEVKKPRPDQRAFFDHPQSPSPSPPPTPSAKRYLYKDKNISFSSKERIEFDIPPFHLSNNSINSNRKRSTKGSFGHVYKCRHRIDGCLYALKKTKKPMKGYKDRNIVLREVYGLSAIKDHTNIVRYYNAWEEDCHIFIQMEFCNGGNVYKWVTEGVRQSESNLLSMAKQILQGIVHIHSLGLVHLDIKPENIYMLYSSNNNNNNNDKIVDSNNNLNNSNNNNNSFNNIKFKIGDLGLLNEATDSKIYSEGDSRYLSRELLHDDMTALKKSDIFSLGCTLYELARCKPLPTCGEEWNSIRNGILVETNDFSMDFWSLLKIMIHPDPLFRPTAEELLLHPLIRFGSFEGLEKEVLLLRSQLQEKELTYQYYLQQKQLQFLQQKQQQQINLLPPPPTNIYQQYQILLNNQQIQFQKQLEQFQLEQQQFFNNSTTSSGINTIHNSPEIQLEGEFKSFLTLKSNK
eukprot:gene1145-1452_t